MDGWRWYKRPSKVVAFRPDVRRLEATIRELAKETSRIGFLTHAQDRMEERGIDNVDVYRVLRPGFVQSESIKQGKRSDETVCKVIEHKKGARDLGVVTIVVRETKLLVMTVEWEDWK